jgi:ElaB/YqjD/DUF883 family membrane-anchored ribosome-binding protein
LEKSKILILQHGLPLEYIKMLAELEDHLQTTLKDKEAIKRLKPAAAKSLNQMKLQVKKHNENYKAEIKDFRENPEKYLEEEEPVKQSVSDDSNDDEDDEEEDNEDDSIDELRKPPVSAIKVN